MGPKKDDGAAAANPTQTTALNGFDARDVKYLAAAFVSQTGPDKYDYDLMASLTGNTKGTLQVTLPKIKKKAAEMHPSLAVFLGLKTSNNAATTGETPTPTPRKRKAKTAGEGNEGEDTPTKPKGKRQKKVPAKSAKSQPAAEDPGDEQADEKQEEPKVKDEDVDDNQDPVKPEPMDDDE